MLDKYPLSTLPTSYGRFSELISAVQPARICDTILYSNEHVLVCPTLGSFLPYWFLMIPKMRCLNFSDWKRITNLSPYQQVSRFISDVFRFPKKYIWFEHGSNVTGSVIGCGVDQAHIHIIMNTKFDLEEMLDATESLGVSDWLPVETSTSYDLRQDSSEYLIFGDEKRAYFTNVSEAIGSQFFRRVLAKINGNRQDWDYKKYPHLENAKKSIEYVMNCAKPQ